MYTKLILSFLVLNVGNVCGMEPSKESPKADAAEKYAVPAKEIPVESIESNGRYRTIMPGVFEYVQAFSSKRVAEELFGTENGEKPANRQPLSTGQLAMLLCN